MADRLAEAGADLRLNTTVAELRPLAGGGAEAMLSDGSIEPVDAVVLAGGVAELGRTPRRSGAQGRRARWRRFRSPPRPW